MATPHIFNPALNLHAFANIDSTPDVPPKNNAIYLRDGAYDDGMSRSDVAAAFRAFDASKESRLALFFHGGLVDKVSGTKAAATQYALYEGACYPYFFVWEAGIWEVLAHHFPSIFSNTIFTALLQHTMDTVAPKVGSAGAAVPTPLIGAPSAMASHPLNQPLTTAQRQAFSISPSDVESSVSSVAGDRNVQNSVAGIARHNLSLTSTMRAMMLRTPSIQRADTDHFNDAIVGLICGAYKDGSAVSSAPLTENSLFAFDIGGMLRAAAALATYVVPTVLRNVARRVARGRDHGILCTLVEEILRVAYLASFGSNVWEEMKNETAAAFGGDASKFGGTAVIEEICERIRAGRKFDITLVGHSTGAIYIGNFLESVDAALTASGNSAFNFDIVLMAPADTFSFYAARYRKRIRALRSFGMTDEAERLDLLMSSDLGSDPSASVLGRTYPRSLLYLISGALETYAPNIPSSPPHDLDTSDMPIFGMDRFFSDTTIFDQADYPEVQRARDYLANVSATNLFMRVLSPTKGGVAGQQCGAHKHGNFPGDQQMQASLIFCLNGGIR